MTYSLTRFAIYETVRDQVAQGSPGPLPFYKKVLLGAISGERPGGQGAGGRTSGGVPRAGPGGHCQWSHDGSGVCHPRLCWRFRGHSSGHGQRQVGVAPSVRVVPVPWQEPWSPDLGWGAGGRVWPCCPLSLPARFRMQNDMKLPQTQRRK